MYERSCYYMLAPQSTLEDVSCDTYCEINVLHVSKNVVNMQISHKCEFSYAAPIYVYIHADYGIE